MTADYPVKLLHRSSQGGAINLHVPAKIGVRAVDAQIDLLAATQEKHRLARDKEAAARAALTDARNASERRLVESMSTDGDPDTSGDAEVTNAELVLAAAERITKAGEQAVVREARSLFEVIGEHRAEVRTALYKRVEKARDTLTGAAFAAEQAKAQLEASAGMLAGLDSFLAREQLGPVLAPKAFGGRVEVGEAASQARTALSAVNRFLDDSWQPAPKKGKPADEDAADDFDEVPA